MTTEVEKQHPATESFAHRWLIMPKLLFFMVNLYAYTFHALLSLIFVHQMKFDLWLYSCVTCVGMASFFGASFWSGCADRTGRYRLLLTVTTVLYTIVSCGLVLYSYFGLKSKIIVFCMFILFNLFLSASFPLMDSLILGLMSTYKNVTKEQFNYQRMYGAIGHFVATLCAFVLWKSDVLDGILIDPRDGKPLDRNIKMAGFQVVVSVIFLATIFFGVSDVQPVKGGHHHGGAEKKKKKETTADRQVDSASPVSSVELDIKEGVHQVPLAQADVMAPSPCPPAVLDELKAPGPESDRRSPFVILMTNPSFLFFLLFASCMGIVRALASNFQKQVMDGLFKENDGLKIAFPDFIRMLSEVGVMLIAKWLKDLMGIYWLLIFSQLMGVARIFGYGILKSEWKSDVFGLFSRQIDMAYGFTWFLELIKGFSSGLVSCSAIPIANRIAPPGCESSAQGIYSGVYSGLSYAIGGLISGAILYYYYRKDDLSSMDKASKEFKDITKEHIRKTFFWVSIGTFVVTVLMALKFVFVDRVAGLPGFPRRRSSV